MEAEIEFNQDEGFITVWYENDGTPFDVKIMGIIRKGDDGYYRFHTSGNTVMTCKHLRLVFSKLSKLNSK